MKFRWLIALLAVCPGIDAFADIQCLSGEAATKAFLSEGKEPYFSLLQPREIAAKVGHPVLTGTIQKQRDQLRTEYRKDVLNCTPDESKALEGYIAVIESQLKPLYPGLVAWPWRIVKVDDTIEGGLPHTRENVIVLSQSMLQAITQSAQQGQWDLNIINILIHEQIHVIQRVKADTFARLYENEWGFRKAASIKGAGSWLAQHQIVNPDGVDVQWVWPVPGTSRVIWPRVILDGDDAAPRMPDDFRMIGIELRVSKEGYSVVTEKDGTPRYRSLQDEPRYVQKFGGISSLYHPNEIAADFLANLAVLDGFVDKSRMSKEQRAKVDEIYNPIRSWARGTFGVADRD